MEKFVKQVVSEDAYRELRKNNFTINTEWSIEAAKQQYHNGYLGTFDGINYYLAK